MHTTPTLATRFARNTFVVRSDTPLAEDQMRSAAPSVFAAGKHDSRSERYTYIPTIDVLRGLRKEGFEAFMVAQGRCRIEGKAEFTKHMIRLRRSFVGLKIICITFEACPPVRSSCTPHMRGCSWTRSSALRM